MIQPTPLPGATPEVRAYAADVFRTLVRSWRDFQALANPREDGSDVLVLEVWSSIAQLAANELERCILRAVLATSPETRDITVHRLHRTGAQPRALAFDGALYVAAPDPNIGQPEGTVNDEQQVMDLVVMDPANLFTLDTPTRKGGGR